MRGLLRRAGLVAVLVLAVACAGFAVERSVSLRESGVFGEPPPSRDVASTIWFQGFLADAATGDPLTGTYGVVMELFDAADGGSSIWGPETHSSVTVTRGWFHVELGSVASPLPAFDDPPYYLEIAVDGEVLSPRQKLASVPSALRASAVDAELTLPYSGAVSSAERAFSVLNSGTSNAGYFEANNPANGSAALSARHEGEGPAVLGWTTGGGAAILGHADGGFAGLFEGSVVVNDTLGVGSFMMPAGAQEGYVLTSDDEWGHASWRRDGLALPYSGSAVADTENIAFEVAQSGSDVMSHAIAGFSEGTGSGPHVAISGTSSGAATGVNRGIEAYAYNSTTSNQALLTVAYSSEGAGYGGIFDNMCPAGYAGLFQDDVEVTGFLYKTGGGFRIDHPFDPLNKYLYHSFVESPDMKNVYDGVVTLDDAGQAWVELPEWFEAINRDFRYQLTAVGAPGPDLHIAERISGNRFKIAGGKSGMEVSWQVTGIRCDPAAEYRRLPVEEEKPDFERGKYRYPQAYGLPKSSAANYPADLAARVGAGP